MLVKLDDHRLEEEESVQAVGDVEAGVGVQPVYAVLDRLPLVALGNNSI